MNGAYDRICVFCYSFKEVIRGNYKISTEWINIQGDHLTKTWREGHITNGLFPIVSNILTCKLLRKTYETFDIECDLF